MEEITQLLDKVSLINQKHEAIAKASGENFNIFSIMRMERNEVKTHSRFIAELLNPKGRHGQGDLFLKLFLEEVKIIDFETEKANVYVEYYVGKVTKTTGGRIDILIKNQKNQVICIENKIYAEEQKNQLLRYYNAFSNDNKVLFLTLKGNQSNNHKNFQKYKSISYQENIINWLEKSQVHLTEKSYLKQAIQQYINIIKKLTNQHINQNMNNEILKEIMKSEDSFKAFVSLNKAKNDVYKSILKEVVFPILDEIDKNNNTLKLHINKGKLLKKSGRNEFYFINDFLEKNNLRITFKFEKNKVQEFIFGFMKIQSKESSEYDSKIIEEFKNKFGNPKNTWKWLCYKSYNGFRNWEKLEVLQRIKYENFNEDINRKIRLMLDIINDVR
ncbi:MAG: PD-(D/E)XK nuclease family protein [Saprospiraceae bacterium]